MARSLLTLTTCLVAFLANAVAEAPYRFNETPGTLPKDVIPTRYDVFIAPSIENETFTGTVSIELQVLKPVRKLVLNSSGLTIKQASLNADAKHPLKGSLDRNEQTLTFPLPNELPAGSARLEIAFSGKLSEAPVGLFITRYATAKGDKKALMTQFQATDARRMFPCWDEPAFRSRFRLTAEVPPQWTAVSNMPVASTKPTASGLARVTFAESPLMPSYLLAFAAGELEVIEDEVDGVKLRALTTEGKREQARYALEVTKQVLPYFNEYFGVKYPLPKLDQVSFASTGASGMENWGAIIYNDLAFLYDPKTSTQGTKERVYEVVAHEIAHQWFGDLVTMGWWDNIWLNEGFASWMATKATDHFNPSWKTWLRSAGDKEYAMQLDARASTHPIQQPVRNSAQADNSFDAITYQKGQSILRMLENWLGEERFRDGIRRYMQRHAYSNTTTADLWAALAEASDKPVAEMAAGWTEQPGFPLVKVTAEDHTVRISQERFASSTTPLPPLSWRVPVSIGTKTLLLGSEPIQITGQEFPPKANAGDIGYYRVHYDRPLFEALVAKIDTLPEADRLNILNDTWALVRASKETVTNHLSLIDRLRNDLSPTIQQQIIYQLSEIRWLIRDTPAAKAFHARLRNFLQPQLTKIGWDQKSGESPLTPPLRASVIGLLADADDATVIAEAKKRFTQYEKDPSSLTGDLRAQVLVIIGEEANDETFARLHQLARGETSTEQKQLLYNAMAATRSRDLAGKVLALSLTNELIPHAATGLVKRVSNRHPESAWTFAKANLEPLLAKVSSSRASDYVPSLFRNFTDRSRADELEAFAKTSLPADAAPLTARAAEQIRLNAELKSRILSEIDAWCAKHIAP